MIARVKFLRGLSIIILGLLVSSCGEAPQPRQYLVGAYYYLWFPYNFHKRGYIRKFLDPPQSPVLGQYNSSDPAVAERHIAWCSRYGIDFLVIDWWPNRPGRNKVLDDGFLRADNIGDIKWCLFYETQSLGMDRATGAITWTEQRIDRLVSDMLKFSGSYFNHPGYLKIDGRPVIFLYLTRNYAGDTGGAIKRVRSALNEKGVDPFIIADEVFWMVTVDGKATFAGRTDAPQESRIELFDAITTYNIYESQESDHQGYPAESRYLPEVKEIYQRYRESCGEDTIFIPNIIPGYNDRPLRKRASHYVIPRQWKEGDPSGSLFSEFFDRLGLAYIDQNIPMIMITSWNEWNEDTAIEPLTPAPPTSRDYSGSGTRFTEGYSYSGFGETYLRIIRDKIVAVLGRVVDAKGEP
ncbi:MAG: glycoside hydrolase family 99-like domain-containing protein, partial [Candidatus Auribacterota bacterium]|nr:glycoside hydrolase family 99-like domain-containing protein [Candidatus Auribacterota bacterium]